MLFSLGGEGIETKPNYKSPKEVYHLAAKKAPNAAQARDILHKAGIGVDSSWNLVPIKTGLHRRLHTNEYYALANGIIIAAYHSAKGNRSKEISYVKEALLTVRGIVLMLESVSPF